MKYFYTAKEFCDHLTKLLRWSKPIAGDGIRIEQTDNGRKIICTVQPVTNSGSASVEYNGCLKVIDASNENTGMNVSIIDGYSADEDICGYVYIDDFYPINTAKDLDVSDSGYVLLTIDSTSKDVVCTITFDHEFDFPQDSEPDIQIIPIAYVSVVTGDDEDETKSISEIQQIQFGIPYLDLLKFPSLITNYDDSKKMALIIDSGVYRFIEIGDCIS